MTISLAEAVSPVVMNAIRTGATDSAWGLKRRTLFCPDLAELNEKVRKEHVGIAARLTVQVADELRDARDEPPAVVAQVHDTRCPGPGSRHRPRAAAPRLSS